MPLPLRDRLDLDQGLGAGLEQLALAFGDVVHLELVMSHVREVGLPLAPRRPSRSKVAAHPADAVITRFGLDVDPRVFERSPSWYDGVAQQIAGQLDPASGGGPMQRPNGVIALANRVVALPRQRIAVNEEAFVLASQSIEVALRRLELVTQPARVA
jgi:hypothetical protein